MTVTAEQVAAATVIVDQFAAASEQLKSGASVVGDMWLSFNGWYNRTAVAALARQTSAISVAQQQQTAGLSAAYVAQLVAAITGGRQPGTPRTIYTPVREGADLRRVHTRPAQVYLRAIGRGLDHDEALALAGNRAVKTMLSDITLEDRLAQQRMLRDLGVVTFRRIIHPELSATGTCGLCVAASQRTYNTGDLMPLHPPTCKCTVMPIIGDNDPGVMLNDADLGQLYGDAGSTKAADLKRTRYTVHQHSELGPMLYPADQPFRDQQQARLENDPARVAAMLRQALPVLDQYRAREESGEIFAKERLDYQEKYVAMLQRYAAGNVAA